MYVCLTAFVRWQVMLTIHQPSSSLYECFDRLMLMAPGGRTTFFGNVEDAVPHFSKLGYPLPPLWAPADHFIELLIEPGTAEKLCEAWVSSGKVEPAMTVPVQEIEGQLQGLSKMPPLLYQIYVLLPRSYKRLRRSVLKKMNVKTHLALSLVWGIIYWQVGNQVEERISDYVSAVFFIIAHWSATPLFQGLNNFPREKEMLIKERASKVYTIEAFFSSQVIAEMPVLLVLPFFFFLIIWPMAAMPLEAVLPAFLLIALNIQVCSAMSMAISAVCMDGEVAISVAIVVMVYQMCAGGYFADMSLLPSWIAWLRFTSVYYYTFGAMLRLLVKPFGDEVYQKAMEKHSFSELGYLWEVLILVGMTVAFRLAAYVQLRISRKLKFS